MDVADPGNDPIERVSNMKTIELTGIDRPAPNVVLGLMRIQDLDDAGVRTLVASARDAGIDFFDHADVYGRDMHGCEQRFSEAMRLSPSEREQITIQTKAGIVREGPYFDFSYEHIIESVEGSLRALDTDYIDILLLHRPDALVEPDEVARAFDELEAAGKVRAFGVSNHTPRQIDLLKKSVRQPLVANQIQLSITHAPSIAQGVMAPELMTALQRAGLDCGTGHYVDAVDVRVLTARTTATMYAATTPARRAAASRAGASAALRSRSQLPHAPAAPHGRVVAGRLAADGAVGLAAGVLGSLALELARLARIVAADDELTRSALDAVVERLGDADLERQRGDAALHGVRRRCAEQEPGARDQDDRSSRHGVVLLRPKSGRFPLIDPMMTIEPEPCPIITGMTALVTSTKPKTLTRNVDSHSSASISHSLPLGPPIPLLLTRLSIRPRSRVTTVTIWAIDIRSVTSVSTTRCLPPACSMTDAVSFRPSRFRAASTTVSPRAASSWAIT